MKATALEFRFRFVIHLIIYVLGFTTPWDRWLHLDAGRTTWLLLASWFARNRWLNFDAATIAVLILGILCTLAAACLRTWGSAYLGTVIVKDASMHGDQIVAAGPYRYVRNPLYLGTFLNTLALALLMPPSGAIFCIILTGLFELRIIAAEEAFLTTKLGEPYLTYTKQVARLIPAITPRVPPSPATPNWPTAFLGEIYMWGAFLSFAVAGWRYNAFLIIRGVLISLGVSLVARAFIPKH
jgi:protein-S-isoprenylcysteine O-methyltransferase Ste14